MFKIRKIYVEPSLFDRIQQSLKMAQYRVMHEMMNQFTCTALIWNLFTLFETFQIIYYTFHPSMPFYYDIVWYQYFLEVIKYFQFNYVLSQSQISIVLLYVFDVILFIVFGLIVACAVVMSSGKKISAFYSYSMKILSFFGICQLTLLSMPLMNIFVVVLICDSSSPYDKGEDCYQGSYLIHLGFAALGSAVYLMISVFYLYLYIDLNPFSETPMAGPQNKIAIYRQIYKLGILIYFTIDYEAKLSTPYLITISIIYAFFIFMRVQGPKFYNMIVYDFNLFCDSMLFLPTFFYLIQIIVIPDDRLTMGLWYMLIGTAFNYYMTQWFVHLKDQYLVVRGTKNLSSELAIEEFLLLVLELIGSGDRLRNRLLLEGIIVQHMKYCRVPECVCKELSQAKIEDDELPQSNKVWYRFVEVLINEGLNKHPKSKRLLILNAYLQKDRLKNRFKSLQSLISVEDLDPNFQEEFTIYRCKDDLEQEMVDEEMRNVEGKMVDVTSIVTFQNYFVEYQQKISNSVGCHHEFWTELLEDSPDSMKLQSLGSQITQSVDDVEQIYKKLLSINPNHIRCLQIYGYFQKDIINNEIEGPRILEKADQIAKSIMLSQGSMNLNNRMADNGLTATITVSGNKGNFGSILNCTRELQKFLGFTPNDLIGQNITRIMPRVIGDVHETFVRDYIDTNESTVIGRERMVLAQNKQGMMVPSKLLIKILPDLERGVQIIGFLQELVEDEEHMYILYDPTTFQIHSMSANCKSNLGLSPLLLFNTQEFTMFNILTDPKVLEEKQNEMVNFILVFNTAHVNEQFMVEQAESELSSQKIESQLSQVLEGEQGNHETQKKLQQLKMKCSVSKQNYKTISLNLLRFHESNEQLELQRQSHLNRSEHSDRKHKKKKKNERNRNDQKLQEQQIEAEDRSSINSVSSSVNDEMRSLKDFKALISEKVVPKQIRNLQITLLVLTIIIVTIESVDLYLRDVQQYEFGTNVNFLQYLYYRQQYLSDITYNARMMQQTGIGNYHRISEYEYFRQNLTDYLQSMQSNQYQIIINRIDLELHGMKTKSGNVYEVVSQLQNGNQNRYNLTLEESIYEIINQGMILKDQDIQGWNSTDKITTTSKSFNYIEDNGLYTLRNASEVESVQDLNFFEDLVTGKQWIFMVLLLLNIFMLILAQFILVPVLRNVRISNIKVLSLFGLIPTTEIKELAQRCENYLTTCLDQQLDHIDLAPETKKKDEQKQQGSNAPGDKKDISVKESKAVDVNYFEVDNEDQDMPQDKKSAEPLIAAENQENNGMKTKAQIEQEQQQQDLEDLRVEKLQAYKGRSSSDLIVKLGAFLILFCGYFIMQFVLEYVYLMNINQLNQHMELAFLRPILIKYGTYFSLESELKPNDINNQLMQEYHDRIYLNDRDLFQQISQTFPSQFDSYLNDFHSLNYNNICENLRLITQKFNRKWCSSVYNGILQKGLRTSIVSLALDAQDTFNHQKPLKSVLNGENFEQLNQMLTYMIPFMNFLNKEFVSCFKDYITYSYLVDTIVFITFIAVWVLLVLLIWIPHLSTLSNQIWRTKGMLNLIPLNIIQKYDRLKEAFLHSNILQMVK